MKEFLQSRKELYKKREGSTEADGTEECAICLAEFKEQDDEFVVVLDCGSASKKVLEEHENATQVKANHNEEQQQNDAEEARNDVELISIE